MRPHPYSILSLILGCTVAAPVFCQTIFEAEGASRATFYNGQCIFGVNWDEDNDYGLWVLNSPGLYESIYTPQVGYVVQQQAGQIIAAECTWVSAPPGARCPWDDQPGSVWMSPNVAESFDPVTYLWWSASSGGLHIPNRGADAARMINGEWVIPLTRRLDQSDRHWHWLGRPEPWWAHSEWFAQLPVWLGVANSHHATMRLRFHETSADFFLTIHAEPLSPVDVDRNGVVVVSDIFHFLSCWFSGSLAGDWDASRSVTVEDIFAYLSEWFGGVP